MQAFEVQIIFCLFTLTATNPAVSWLKDYSSCDSIICPELSKDCKVDPILDVCGCCYVCVEDPQKRCLLVLKDKGWTCQWIKLPFHEVSQDGEKDIISLPLFLSTDKSAKNKELSDPSQITKAWTSKKRKYGSKILDKKFLGLKDKKFGLKHADLLLKEPSLFRKQCNKLLKSKKGHDTEIKKQKKPEPERRVNSFSSSHGDYQNGSPGDLKNVVDFAYVPNAAERESFEINPEGDVFREVTDVKITPFTDGPDNSIRLTRGLANEDDKELKEKKLENFKVDQTSPVNRNDRIATHRQYPFPYPYAPSWNIPANLAYGAAAGLTSGISTAVGSAVQGLLNTPMNFNGAGNFNVENIPDGKLGKREVLDTDNTENTGVETRQYGLAYPQYTSYGTVYPEGDVRRQALEPLLGKPSTGGVLGVVTGVKQGIGSYRQSNAPVNNLGQSSFWNTVETLPGNVAYGATSALTNGVIGALGPITKGILNYLPIKTEGEGRLNIDNVGKAFGRKREIQETDTKEATEKVSSDVNKTAPKKTFYRENYVRKLISKYRQKIGNNCGDEASTTNSEALVMYEVPFVSDKFHPVMEPRNKFYTMKYKQIPDDIMIIFDKEKPRENEILNTPLNEKKDVNLVIENDDQEKENTPSLIFDKKLLQKNGFHKEPKFYEPSRNKYDVDSHDENNKNVIKENDKYIMMKDLALRRNLIRPYVGSDVILKAKLSFGDVSNANYADRRETEMNKKRHYRDIIRPSENIDISRSIKNATEDVSSVSTYEQEPSRDDQVNEAAIRQFNYQGMPQSTGNIYGSQSNLGTHPSNAYGAAQYPYNSYYQPSMYSQAMQPSNYGYQQRPLYSNYPPSPQLKMQNSQNNMDFNPNMASNVEPSFTGPMDAMGNGIPEPEEKEPAGVFGTLKKMVSTVIKYPVQVGGQLITNGVGALANVMLSDRLFDVGEDNGEARAKTFSNESSPEMRPPDEQKATNGEAETDNHKVTRVTRYLKLPEMDENDVDFETKDMFIGWLQGKSETQNTAKSIFTLSEDLDILTDVFLESTDNSTYVDNHSLDNLRHVLRDTSATVGSNAFDGLHRAVLDAEALPKKENASALSYVFNNRKLEQTLNEMDAVRKQDNSDTYFGDKGNGIVGSVQQMVKYASEPQKLSIDLVPAVELNGLQRSSVLLSIIKAIKRIGNEISSSLSNSVFLSQLSTWTRSLLTVTNTGKDGILKVAYAFPEVIKKATPKLHETNTRNRSPDPISFTIQLLEDNGVTNNSSRYRFARSVGRFVREGSGLWFDGTTVLKSIQLGLKFSCDLIKSVTGYVPASALTYAINLSGLPGAKVLSSIVYDAMSLSYDIASSVGNSKFITEQPTQDSLLNVVLDTGIPLIGKLLNVSNCVLNNARKAFKEIKLEEPQTSAAAPSGSNHLLNQLHKILRDIFGGIKHLTDSQNSLLLSNSIKGANVLLANEISFVVKEVMRIINEMAAKFLETTFLKNSPSWESAKRSIVLSLKSVIITGLESVVDELKSLLSVHLSLRGRPVDIRYEENCCFNITEGAAIRLVGKTVDMFRGLPLDELLLLIQKIFSSISKAVASVTGSAVATVLPYAIRYSGVPMSEYIENAVSYTFEKLNILATLVSKSTFLTSLPSWEIALDFIRVMIRGLLNVTINIQRIFDDFLDRSGNSRLGIFISSWLSKLRNSFPETYLQYMQALLKRVHESVQRLTNKASSEAVGAVVKKSGMPYSGLFSNLTVRIMSTINEFSSTALNSRFMTSKPTWDNFQTAFIELLRIAVRLKLRFVRELLENVLQLMSGELVPRMHPDTGTNKNIDATDVESDSKRMKEKIESILANNGFPMDNDLVTKPLSDLMKRLTSLESVEKVSEIAKTTLSVVAKILEMAILGGMDIAHKTSCIFIDSCQHNNKSVSTGPKPINPHRSKRQATDNSFNNKVENRTIEKTPTKHLSEKQIELSRRAKNRRKHGLQMKRERYLRNGTPSKVYNAGLMTFVGDVKDATKEISSGIKTLQKSSSEGDYKPVNSKGKTKHVYRKTSAMSREGMDHGRENNRKYRRRNRSKLIKKHAWKKQGELDERVGTQN